jgi:hypothetical protein
LGISAALGKAGLKSWAGAGGARQSASTFPQMKKKVLFKTNQRLAPGFTLI